MLHLILSPMNESYMRPCDGIGNKMCSAHPAAPQARGFKGLVLAYMWT